MQKIKNVIKDSTVFGFIYLGMMRVFLAGLQLFVKVNPQQIMFAHTVGVKYLIHHLLPLKFYVMTLNLRIMTLFGRSMSPMISQMYRVRKKLKWIQCVIFGICSNLNIGSVMLQLND